MPVLEAVRVVDFSRVLAGPLASMMLGDLGADVVKVEHPEGGDDTRSWGPPFDDRGRATYFEAVNRNKRSLSLDLKDPAGLAEARRLSASADVLIENFRPGVMERLGLGYPELREGNRGLVYCSITAFGRGPGAKLAGYDLLVQALGGLMSITGEAGGEPQKVGVALVDVLAGLYATVGILAALRDRDRNGGEGQRVEVELLTALLASLVNQASAHTLAGEVPTRMGNAHPSIAPYELFATGEGDIALAVGNDGQFERLCRVIGKPDLATDPRFASNSDRVENRDALKRELEGALAGDGADSWAARLESAGVPAGKVNDIAQALELARKLGLEPTVEIPRDDGTSAVLVRNPIGLSGSPASYLTPPPALGGAGGT